MIDPKYWSALEAVNGNYANDNHRALVTKAANAGGGLTQAARDARAGKLRDITAYAV